MAAGGYLNLPSCFGHSPNPPVPGARSPGAFESPKDLKSGTPGLPCGKRLHN